MKKTLSGIIFRQTGMRQAEKERKKFQTRILFIHDPGKKILKKIEKKNQKIKKPISGIIFSHNGIEIGREREKKILLPNSVPTQAELENSK